MSSPPEGPEHRTDTLSPVSPKPLHYPAPSNIALLENQMDPNLDLNATESHELVSQGTERTVYRPDAGNQEASTQDAQGPSNTLPTQEIHAAVDALSNDTNTNTIDTTYQPLHSSNLSSANAVSSEQSFAQNQLASTPNTSAPNASAAPSTDEHQFESQPQSFPGQSDPSSQGLIVPQYPSASSDPSEVDVQALINDLKPPMNLSTAPDTSSMNVTSSQPADTEVPVAPSQSSGSAAAAIEDDSTVPTSDTVDLPARPPLQAFANPSLQQGLSQSAEPSPSGTEGDASAASFHAPLANAAPPLLPTAGAPGVQVSLPVSLPPSLPSLNTTQQHPLPGALMGGYGTATSATEQEDQNAKVTEHAPKRGIADDENIRWNSETQNKYDAFLAAERNYVLEGSWDKFPPGSRLFVGNLASERVTKRDLFHVFHRYGRLAQISIKQAYGFVQYLDARDCDRAKRAEQGVSIRGKTINLEISMPGGRKRQQQNDGRASRNRRSRSPTGSRNSGRDSRNDNRYRPRSPDRHRTPMDFYDGREARSPRVRSPPRSSSRFADDGLPLPHRLPNQIPDVQVIARDPLDKPFVEYLERTFSQRSMRADVLFHGGMDENLLVRRQIVEGVLAIMRIDNTSRFSQRFSLTVFERSQGGSNVRFDEYRDLPIPAIMEVVDRAKQQARSSRPAHPATSMPPPPQPPPNPYQQPPPHQLGLQPFPPLQSPPVQSPSNSNPPGANNQQLQQILEALGKQQQQQPGNTGATAPLMPPIAQPQPQSQQPSPHTTQPPAAMPDLAQILSAVQQQPQGQSPSAGGGTHQNTQQAPQTEQQQQQQPLDMAQIISQLNRYGRS